MAFESGNISFRIFWHKERLSEDVIERFAANICPDISTLSTSPINGWMGWKHLLDRDISLESCYFQPWLYLSLNQAERKVPKPLLAAYCKLEEEAERKARGLEFLPRKLKAEIKQRVVDSLTPEMPPTLTGIPVVMNLATGYLYVASTKQSMIDAFHKHFREASNVEAISVASTEAALILKQVNSRDYAPAVFSEELGVVPPSECSFGLEFLTWLWFYWEKQGGLFESQIGEKCSYMLEGPITFFNEGKGAHNVVLSRGLPLQGKEAGIALLCGKKVSKIKINLVDSEKVWSATIDSDFTVRGLKLPKDKENASRPTFQERMELVDKFVNSLFRLYSIFLDLRKDDASWKSTVREMTDWVKSRAEMEDGNMTEHEE